MAGLTPGHARGRRPGEQCVPTGRNERQRLPSAALERKMGPFALTNWGRREMATAGLQVSQVGDQTSGVPLQ